MTLIIDQQDIEQGLGGADWSGEDMQAFMRGVAGYYRWQAVRNRWDSERLHGIADCWAKVAAGPDWLEEESHPNPLGPDGWMNRFGKPLTDAHRAGLAVLTQSRRNRRWARENNPKAGVTRPTRTTHKH